MAELARAYITIVPSMEGARGTIEQELGGAGEAAGSSAGSRAGGAFSSALGAAARVGAAAVTAAAGAATALTTQVVSAYSNYEQLTGGIETLYGEASAQMMQYASEAATSTGQSMNQFMESAIATSAAMITAVEGDQARAAELTNMSMIDMADNANKLGTDMESIQNAYRGFSRGNFTMLDNLALGYAGTREGMQQLLEDAQAISGVEYNIDSYADIVEAIHAVQENMGIAGTTASEASETIQGSLGALSASWQNLLIGIADPSADLNGLIENLVANAETALTNLVPTIVNALTGFSQVITSLAPIISTELPGLIANLVPPLLTAAGDILMALGQGIIMMLPTLAPIISDLIIQLVFFITENLPLVVDSAIQIILAITTGLAQAAPDLIPAIVDCVLLICQTLIDNIDELILAAQELFFGILMGLAEATPSILEAIPELIVSIITAFGELGPQLVNNALEWGMDFINSLVEGISNAIPNLISGVTSVADTIASYLHFSVPEKGPLSDMDEHGGAGLIRNFVEGIEEESPALEATLNRELSMPTVSELSTLDSVNDAYSNADNGNLVIPVYIGQERLDTIMIRSSQMATYRRGG